MRVPIHPDDLNSRHGFKRIAKKLQRGWPGLTPIQLSFAREILSKGLGYRDYHDVTESSKKWQPDALVPSKEEVDSGILSAISAAIQVDQKFVIVPLILQAFVRSLPLNALVVLKGHQAGKADNYTPLEPSYPLFKTPRGTALVGTEIGFCSTSFHQKPVEKHMRCSMCSNCIVPTSLPYMDRPTLS